MKIYVCSPLRGDINGNLERCRKYCRAVAELGHIPLAPHLYFTQFLDDTIPEERELGMEMGLELLMICDEIWVFGQIMSTGMATEIAYAEHTEGIDVRYIPTGD